MSDRSAYRHNTPLSLTITLLFVILSALLSVACTNAMVVGNLRAFRIQGVLLSEESRFPKRLARSTA